MKLTVNQLKKIIRETAEKEDDELEDAIFIPDIVLHTLFNAGISTVNEELEEQLGKGWHAEIDEVSSDQGKIFVTSPHGVNYLLHATIAPMKNNDVKHPRDKKPRMKMVAYEG